jgi:hypothetical protein
LVAAELRRLAPFRFRRGSGFARRHALQTQTRTQAGERRVGFRALRLLLTGLVGPVETASEFETH